MNAQQLKEADGYPNTYATALVQKIALRGNRQGVSVMSPEGAMTLIMSIAEVAGMEPKILIKRLADRYIKLVTSS